MAYRDVPACQLADLVLRNVLRRVPANAWAERAALWWGSRFRAGPRVVRLRGGASMLVEPRDYLLMSLYYLGTFEPYCLRLLPRLLPPGGTMVDVGANVGVYTLTAAQVVGPRGRVIAIEPAPPAVADLRANVARNGFSQVTVVEAAAGPAPGQATLSLPPAGNSGMFTLGGVGGPVGHQVAVRRLDDVLEDARVDRVDLVKMDVEGSEYAALLGGRGLIEAHRPAFLIELNDSALRGRGHSSGDVKRLLHEAGYLGWTVTRRGLTPLTADGSHDCDECLFLHERSVDAHSRVVRRVACA